MTMHTTIKGDEEAAPPAELQHPLDPSNFSEAAAHFRKALAALSAETDARLAVCWTPKIQAHFIGAIAEGATIADPAAQVGLSARSAYALRHRKPGQGFDLGWQAATLLARDALHDELHTRALEGQRWVTERDDGTRVITTTRHRHDNRLALAMLTKLEAKADAARGTHAGLVARSFDAYLSLLADDALPADMADLNAALAPSPQPAANDSGMCEACESNGAPVWHDGSGWLTNFLPPADFDGEEYGIPGGAAYFRELSCEELDHVEHFAVPPSVPDPAEAERAAWFAAAARAACPEDVVVREEEEEEQDFSPPTGRGLAGTSCLPNRIDDLRGMSSPANGARAPTGEGFSSESDR